MKTTDITYIIALAMAVPTHVPAAAASDLHNGTIVLVSTTNKQTAEQPPQEWAAWAKWADKLHSVSDAQGHGPDIGSEEWSGALDKQLKIRDAAGHGPDVGSAAWRRAVEKKLAPKAVPTPVPDKQRDLLSAHDTVARFTGLKDHRCMGLTTLCPDRCGESGKLATFAIVKYLAYEKPGQYGDPKQEQFMVLIEDNMKNPKVPKAIRDAVLALKPGDLVHLQWNHDYVTREGAKFPERPIKNLSVLTKEQAEKATAAADDKPKKD
ncbi:MAG: hypothetical protein NTV46_01620 [Verrucomicrobia bacterium]|nr:hypothetical protein [Verrucomicrobiota bacterium]